MIARWSAKSQRFPKRIFVAEGFLSLPRRTTEFAENAERRK
jgi:hypothetical protein